MTRTTFGTILAAAGICLGVRPAVGACSTPSSCLPLQDSVTLTCIPVSFIPEHDPQFVEVECWLIPNSDMTLGSVEVDVPCNLPGGTEGTVTIDGAFVDTAHVDPPFVGSPLSLTPINLTGCFVAVAPPILAPSIGSVQAGETYYIATFVYELSPCAAGTFTVNIENFSDPPNSGDITCVKKTDGCPAELLIENGSLTLPTSPGTCCFDPSCQVDGISARCCEAAYSGAVFHEGKSCADANPCPRCTLAEQLDLPCCIVYGDVFPSPPNGVINVDDILCPLRAFGDMSTCPSADIFPCGGGNGVIDVDDIVAELAAFAFNFPCDPCVESGACCVGTQCFGGIQSNDCLAQEGIYGGNGSICPIPHCPNGACCVGSQCVQATGSDCNAAGGSYVGDGSLCSEITDCTPGACCVQGSGCFDDVLPGDCAGSDSVFQGPATTCAQTTCPFGACCVSSTCLESLTQNQCMNTSGGIYMGDGTQCPQITCPSGACCTPSVCLESLNERQCDEDVTGGIYQGDGTVCSELTCPFGACCTGADSCFAGVTSGTCQSSLSGLYMGDGSLCQAVTCPLGACCIGSTCFADLTASECNMLGGTYAGDGTECTPTGCP